MRGFIERGSSRDRERMALPILFSFFPRSPRKIKVGWHIYNSVPRTITHCHTHGRRAHLLHEKATPPRMDVGRNIIRPLREPLHRANEGSQMCHGNGVARSSSTYSPSPHILHHHERFIFWCVKSFIFHVVTTLATHVLRFFVA